MRVIVVMLDETFLIKKAVKYCLSICNWSQVLKCSIVFALNCFIQTFDSNNWNTLVSIIILLLDYFTRNTFRLIFVDNDFTMIFNLVRAFLSLRFWKVASEKHRNSSTLQILWVLAKQKHLQVGARCWFYFFKG